MANSCVAAVELLWILLPRVTASSSREVTGSRYPDNGRRWDSASKLTSRPQVTRPPGGASHLQTRHPRWSTLAPAREVLQGSWQLGPTAAPALVSSVLSLGRFSTSQRQGLKNCHLSKSSSLRDAFSHMVPVLWFPFFNMAVRRSSSTYQIVIELLIQPNIDVIVQRLY